MTDELSNIDAALRTAYLARASNLSGNNLADTVHREIRNDAEHVVTVEEATNLVWRFIPTAAFLVLVAFASAWNLEVDADLPYVQALAADPLSSLTGM